MQSEKIIERIVSWLKDYAEKSRCKRLCNWSFWWGRFWCGFYTLRHDWIKVLALEMPIRQQKRSSFSRFGTYRFLKINSQM